VQNIIIQGLMFLKSNAWQGKGLKEGIMELQSLLTFVSVEVAFSITKHSKHL
jgi:hypothetical protein